ncbi:MAG: universal stress protein [Actinomycetota bacterium]
MPGTGGTDVLVGIDGSDGAREAARASLSIVGSVGRCTLAAVLDRDVLSARVEREERQRMLDALEAASALLPDRQPDTVLLEGKPSDALARYAAEGGYELLVVGRRGDGASKALLGSTAATLARGGEVPILIV